MKITKRQAYTREDSGIRQLPMCQELLMLSVFSRAIAKRLLEEASEADDFVNCFVAYFLQEIAFTIRPHGDT
ncbi:hypothetical protein FFI39_002665 [Janthinobacterium sp. KBS0711]|uniref:hypothetical protein n=1 Tax=unclassified Janthinobacterium TaxID=2610881 RepID=UPI00110F3473|nr:MULTISPECIES: hypothetical protein [unclassified Janthinobacterium]TSD70012.1 hypothetical protein FFI39_002665 [Janthinobacterium sp. KBS0711]